MARIRVAVAGVGNCCSSLVQGVQFHRGGAVGLLHEEVGGYTVSDIEFACAFDADRRKVGRDLSEAVLSEPNSAPRIADLPRLGAPVLMGPALDGVGGLVEVADGEPSDVAAALEGSGADVLVNLVPGGAERASAFYAEEAAEAGCAFVNATPAGVARSAVLSDRFRVAGLPLVGDDLLDQVGATAVHMGLLEFLHSRGVRVEESYQLDVGGGAESLDTLQRTRDLKRGIKTAAVAASVPYGFPLVSGSTDYVEFLGGTRDSFLWVKGRYFGGSPFSMDVRLSAVDAPNAGSILLDVVRGVKLASDRGLGGVILPLSAYGFKSSPVRYPLGEAYRMFREFVGG